MRTEIGLIVLIRSDTGDGGWSLHLKSGEDAGGVPDRILLSGKSGLDDGGWLRPDSDDYAAARRIADA